MRLLLHSLRSFIAMTVEKGFVRCDDITFVKPAALNTLSMVKGGKGGSVYIMTNANKGVVYIGVTSDLVTRIIEHREKLYPRSFTARYNLVHLVYYENFNSIEEAIAREKQLKAGSRKRKDDLITKFNPEWNDLYEVIKDW